MTLIKQKKKGEAILVYLIFFFHFSLHYLQGMYNILSAGDVKHPQCQQ